MRGLLFLVFLGFEDLGDLALHELDELLHVAPELAAFSRRELDGPRAVGVLEIVDVAPVVGHGQLPGDPLYNGPDDGISAGARNAGHKDVVSVVRDGEAELDGRHCALLADDLIGGNKFRCSFKREFGGIAGMPEFGGGHFTVMQVHGVFLPRCSASSVAPPEPVSSACC